MAEKKSTALAKQDDLNPGIFMQQAIDKGLTPELMKGFMDLYDRWEAKKGKKEFDAAMAAFQGECPIIVKEKKVSNKDGSPRYTYAPLDQIVKQTQKAISKNGLSYTINATQESHKVTATIIVTHTAGHSQASSFTVDESTDGFMSGPQKSGAALTYAKRYAFCNAFGILTQDPDTDATPARAAGKGADDKTYQLALTTIGKAKSLDELAQFKTSIENGRGKSIYGEEQRNQLLRMINGKAQELGAE